MTLLAQRGASSNEAADHDFAAAVSRSLQPNDPYHRQSLTAGVPKAGNYREATSNLLRPFRSDSYTDESSTPESANQMDELMNVGELAAEADDELLARYQQDDDEAAFAVIHDRHRDGLLAYARQRLDNALSADAEDIVQRTFLQFHVNRKRYAPKTGVLALLYKMVGDNCTEHLRSVGAQKRDYTRKRRLYDPNNKDDDGRDQDNVVPDPKADPAERERKSLVDELLATLTPKQAEAIRLVRIDGHTAESAAELLDLPPTTIRKRIKDGIDRLRKRASANG